MLHKTDTWSCSRQWPQAQAKFYLALGLPSEAIPSKIAPIIFFACFVLFLNHPYFLSISVDSLYFSLK